MTAGVAAVDNVAVVVGNAGTSHSEPLARPAFCDEVRLEDGTMVRVEAEEGAFPVGAMLEVEVPSNEDEQDARTVVSAEREDGVHVAASYTYDVRIVSEEGEELEPVKGTHVTVSFSRVEVADQNLATSVYHVKEADALVAVDGKAELEASRLETVQEGTEVVATTNGFSLYTVEFTYGELQYVMEGGSTVALADVLDAVGLTGEVTAVDVSDESLFFAQEAEGTWYATSAQAFSTDEWMDVTVADVTYRIVVTDDQPTASAGDGVVLGVFNHGTNKFENATGMGGATYNTLVVGYSYKSGSETITFPTVSGYTKNTAASTEGYTYTYTFADKTSKQVAEEFIRDIAFSGTTNNTEIYFALSKQESTSSDVKTLYYSGTQHYYQYVPVAGSSWTDAYNRAKEMTYNGMQGYLATITSKEEDLFVYRAASAVGWLGGTCMGPGDENGRLYYSSFNTSALADDWYWACGPERGEVFYKDRAYSAANDTTSANMGYYYNWRRVNNDSAHTEPNNITSSKEYCLTTLQVGPGKATGSSVSYSWNNIPVANLPSTSGSKALGFFVEYGDSPIGDSGAGATQSNSTTAYANFKKWQVAFDLGATGASCAATSKEVGNGSTYGDLPTPTYPGHTFKGWYTDLANGEQVLPITPVNLTGNQTLYARWELDSPTITSQPAAVDDATYGAIPDTAQVQVAAIAPASGMTMTYQWYRASTDDSSGGVPIAGATNPTYRVPKDADAGTYYYYCVLSVTDGTDTVMVASEAAKAVVRQADLMPTVSIDDWMEGSVPSAPKLSGNVSDGVVTYAYKPKGAADSAYTSDVPTMAGDYVVRATVAPTRNYNGATATAGFAIHATSTGGGTDSRDSDGNGAETASNAGKPSPGTDSAGKTGNDASDKTTGTDLSTAKSVDGQNSMQNTAVGTVVPTNKLSTTSTKPPTALATTADASLPAQLLALIAGIGVSASYVGALLRRRRP